MRVSRLFSVSAGGRKTANRPSPVGSSLRRSGGTRKRPGWVDSRICAFANSRVHGVTRSRIPALTAIEHGVVRAVERVDVSGLGGPALARGGEDLVDPASVLGHEHQPAEGVDEKVVAIGVLDAGEVRVEHSERTRMRELFGLQKLREGVYTSAQMDTKWTDAIEADFAEWRKTVNLEEFAHLDWGEKTQAEAARDDEETLI